MERVTPGQAQWVLGRLLLDRRITQREVQRYVADMGREIYEIEQRLALLRDVPAHTHMVSVAARSAAGTPRRSRKGRTAGAKGPPRGIAGTLAVLLRSVPAAEHAAIAAIRANKGIKAAIRAARASVRKR